VFISIFNLKNKRKPLYILLRKFYDNKTNEVKLRFVEIQNWKILLVDRIFIFCFIGFYGFKIHKINTNVS